MGTYGSRVGGLALVIFGLGYPWRFDWIGGAFLRLDWFAAVIAGICLLERERPAWAGALLGYAAAGPSGRGPGHDRCGVALAAV